MIWLRWGYLSFFSARSNNLCLYCTKLEPISKIGNVSHARSAWWLEPKSYAPRTPRHRLASLGNPKKKNVPCFSVFRGGDFF